MPPKATKKDKEKDKAQPAASGLNAELDKELAEAKMLNLVKFADEACDMSVEVFKTGFPQLDYVLHRKKLGCPLGRDVEIFSKDPEMGKTSLGLQLLAAAQRVKLRTAIDDVERTITDELLAMYGIVTDPKQSDVYAARVMCKEKKVLPAEVHLDTILAVSNIFDVILVDSIAALEKADDLAKSCGDNEGVGGVSKKMSAFCRKNVAKRATIIWINQTRMKVGPAGPAGPGTVTTGGRAMPFYASVRLVLTPAGMDWKIKQGEDVIGMKIKVFTDKNKVSPQFQFANLTYLFGKGFSSHYDYYELALKLGAVQKSSSWISFEIPERLVEIPDVAKQLLENQLKDWAKEKGWKLTVDGGEKKLVVPKRLVKTQGALGFVEQMELDAELFDAVRLTVDGTDVVDEEVTAAAQDAEEPAA